MNLTYVRKYQRFLRKTQGIFYKNPLLSLGLALPLVVIPSYGLTGTTAISAVMLVCFIPTVLIASLLRKKVPQPWRAVLYPLISCLLLIPSRMMVKNVSPLIFDSLGFPDLRQLAAHLHSGKGAAAKAVTGARLCPASVAGCNAGRLCLRRYPRAFCHRQPLGIPHFTRYAPHPHCADGFGRIFAPWLFCRLLPAGPPRRPVFYHESRRERRTSICTAGR